MMALLIVIGGLAVLHLSKLKPLPNTIRPNSEVMILQSFPAGDRARTSLIKPKRYASGGMLSEILEFRAYPRSGAPTRVGGLL
ncbi:jg2144 [Pararge aegeria aegeria]|uniref:Jg2144 protein n=1 Tax=Pararge aegeria aegeria TaxID=348720 RepID=A0A8S4RWW1_9NEOP|nr:jg2144 [Pararge aegeria aegeria]